MTTAPLLHRPAGPHVLDEPSVRVGMAGFALFVFSAVVAVLDPPDAVGTALFLGLAALLCARLTPTGAAGIGLAAWAFTEGFVLHSGGSLSLAPSDLWLLVAAVLVCLAPALLRPTPRRTGALDGGAR